MLLAIGIGLILLGGSWLGAEPRHSTEYGRAPTSLGARVVTSTGTSAALEISFGNPSSTPTGTIDQSVVFPSANYSEFINSNWTNVQASYTANGTPIYSWIEANASDLSTHTLLWLRLDSIPAHGAVSVSLLCGPKSAFDLSESGYTGENPLLSPRYAEFDNGGRVFNFYDNFSGSALGPLWEVRGGWTYAVHNEFTVTATGGSGAYIASRENFTGPSAVDFEGDLYQNASATAYVVEGMGSSACATCGNASAVGWDAQVGAGPGPIVELGSGQAFGTSVSATQRLATFTSYRNGSSSAGFLVNGSQYQEVLAVLPAAPQPVGLAMAGNPAGTFTNAETTYWIRERSPVQALAFPITVVPMPLLTLGAFPGTLPVNASLTLSVATGAWPYTSFVYSGLPPGCISVDASSLSCLARTAGTYEVQVTASDSVGNVETAYANVTVLPNPTVGPGPLRAELTSFASSVPAGQPFTLVASATGGVPPYAYLYSGLPSGCASRNSSSLGCTPSAAGNFTLHVTVTDSHEAQASASSSLTVGPASHPTNSSSAGTSTVPTVDFLATAALAVVGFSLALVSLLRGRARAKGVPPPPPNAGGR